MPRPSGAIHWAVLTGTVRSPGVLTYYVKKEEILTDTHFSCLSRMSKMPGGVSGLVRASPWPLDSTSLAKFLRGAQRWPLLVVWAFLVPASTTSAWPLADRTKIDGMLQIHLLKRHRFESLSVFKKGLFIVLRCTESDLPNSPKNDN